MHDRPVVPSLDGLTDQLARSECEAALGRRLERRWIEEER